MVTEVRHKSQLLAVIVSQPERSDGIQFFTPPELSQQLAFMRHPKGRVISAHCHKPMPREVLLTQEVLVLRKGRLRVDFYDDDKAYIESRILIAGDVILLAGGGHGFEVLEDLEMFEIKQGPYVGEEEKTRFTSVDPQKIRISDE